MITANEARAIPEVLPNVKKDLAKIEWQIKDSAIKGFKQTTYYLGPSNCDEIRKSQAILNVLINLGYKCREIRDGVWLAIKIEW